MWGLANETVLDERASSMAFVQGARRGARALTSAAVALALVVMAVGCTGKKRPFGEGVPGVDGMEESVNSEGDVAGAMPVTPGMGGVDEEALGLAPLDQKGPPGDAVSGRESETCGGDSGACVSTDDLGNGSACVPTGPRDCTSDLDNDCDGQPDNVLDDVCVCVPESVEPCEEHPGLDGRGQCRAGTRPCILGEGNLSSDWGECEGSVGPGEQDSCSVAGDDTDCDGINNGGCPCVEGETRPCGPNTEDGICQRGTQTCVNATFGQCVGAVFPTSRNCASNQDNDCDARADNTVDNVCTCAIGSVQACGAHPGRDGNGPCQAGSQTCAGRANNSTSSFGACSGSVGPAAQEVCDGQDNDCDGQIDNDPDVSTDSNNCGVCGRGCQGGTCASGQCQPFALVSGRTSPNDILVDNNNVYWIDSAGVNRFPKNGGGNSTITTIASTGALSLQRDGSTLYWGASNDVFRAAVTATTAENFLPDREGTVNAVYFTPGFLYWGEDRGAARVGFRSSAIARVNLQSLETIISTFTNATGGRSLGVQGECNWGAEPETDQSIFRNCAGQSGLNDGTFRAFFSLVVRGFHVSGPEITDVYIGALGRGLLRLGLGQIPEAVLVPSTGPMGAVLRDGDFVYFVDGASATTTCTANGVLSRVTTGGENRIALSSAQSCLAKIAVDNNAIYWTNFQSGQIMKLAKPAQ